MNRSAFALLVLIIAGCVPPTSSASPSGSGSDDAAARAYCTEKGGMLVDRVAIWNTNADPSAWLQLAGRMTLCEFESGEGDQTTRIAVDLVTLYSEQPTMAAIAYLSKVPLTLPSTPSENPGAYNCDVGLGGAEAFGNTATAGGWVDTSQPIFVVMDLCVFADGSTIDEFGIFYYATGAVRGADLAPILRYQPGDRLPAMFEETPR
jgi:hypothetical protein